jgi:hypothetical protein
MGASLTMLVVQAGRQRQQPLAVDDREVRHPLRVRAPASRAALDALGPACRAEVAFSAGPNGQPGSHARDRARPGCPVTPDEFLGLATASHAAALVALAEGHPGQSRIGVIPVAGRRLVPLPQRSPEEKQPDPDGNHYRPQDFPRQPDRQPRPATLGSRYRRHGTATPLRSVWNPLLVDSCRDVVP